MKTAKPEILYHYTSMSVLCSLLNNLKCTSENPSLDTFFMSFWLTEHGYMNDPTERWFFLNSLQNALVNYQNRWGLEDKSHFFNLTYSIWDQMQGDKYILSLSENDDILAMWRAYGENGKGVAIGLNAGKLEDFFEKEEKQLNEGISKQSDKSVFKFLGINYTPVADHIYSFPEYYLEKIYHSIQTREDGSTSGNMNILAELVDDERYSYKNDAYREEKEWRLIFISNGSCEFRERNGLIIPYKPLRIPLEALESITLGPCTDKELSKESLSNMLFYKTQGLASEKNVKIIFSDVPYTQR